MAPKHAHCMQRNARPGSVLFTASVSGWGVRCRALTSGVASAKLAWNTFAVCTCSSVMASPEERSLERRESESRRKRFPSPAASQVAAAGTLASRSVLVLLLMTIPFVFLLLSARFRYLRCRERVQEHVRFGVSVAKYAVRIRAHWMTSGGHENRWLNFRESNLRSPVRVGAQSSGIPRLLLHVVCSCSRSMEDIWILNHEGIKIR